MDAILDAERPREPPRLADERGPALDAGEAHIGRRQRAEHTEPPDARTYVQDPPRASLRERRCGDDRRGDRRPMKPRARTPSAFDERVEHGVGERPRTKRPHDPLNGIRPDDARLACGSAVHAETSASLVRNVSTMAHPKRDFGRT